MFVASGSRLTWIGQFGDYSFYNQTSTDAIQQVAAGLRNKYSLFIEQVADGIGAADFQPGSISITLRTDMDRGNGSDGQADIQSNVDDEFALQGNAVVSSSISPLSGATTSAPTPTDAGGANYDSCSTLGDKIKNALPTWLGGTPVTDSQRACYTKQNVAQIGTVATNASAAYGAGSNTAQVAALTATQQQAASAKDTNTLADQAVAAAKKADESQKNLLIMGAIAVAVVVGVVLLLPYTLPRG
jgi:hypothetical protein